MDENDSVEDFTSSEDDVDISSPDSTPTKYTPFQPRFRVQIPDAVKDGDALLFTLKVFKWDVIDEEISTVKRQYEDVEWLHHLLVTANNTDGVIIPPLPPRPEADAKSAESKSKKQLGSDTKIIMPDEFSKDSRVIEKYLQLMIAHEVFGKDKNLETFLCEEKAPEHTKINMGLLGRLSTSVERARKGHHRDIDEYFHKKREWAADYSKIIKETSSNFNKMVYAQMRLGTCYEHVSTALNCSGLNRDDESVKVNRLLITLSRATEDSKHGLEMLSASAEKTLGFELDLNARYMDSVKEMLFRRTCLLIDYQDANRALEKAKPQKKQAAEEVQATAQKAYDNCCEQARNELKSFLQQRMLSFQDGLILYAESQIKTARDTYALLTKTMMVLKQSEL
ncbi:hypothetical protein CHS0354_004225 [Potamilus streckersoni]|uniref:PX domain-containing protein n=1 Tax=Potamilus streckersoni TaxID=2493646 RepID=A0AAE0RRP7_9BIVA|nr:hypothetical protein CHS0354_004225 [Potamilus streckersoni]